MYEQRPIPHDDRYKEGVESLLWISADRGAFGNTRNGPLNEWLANSADFMKHVTDFSLVIQAGGNCGMYARFYGNYFDNVISIEPDKDNFHCLSVNCSGEKYQLHNAALGKEFRKVSLNKYNSINSLFI